MGSSPFRIRSLISLLMGAGAAPYLSLIHISLGTQLYDDVASDPQQKNIITLSVNDCELNANYHKKWYEEVLYTDDENKTKATFIVGSAKSVTTRTEISTTKGDYKDADEYGYSPTVKSVSVGASEETLSMLPSSAHLYLNFHISEQQPAAAVSYTHLDVYKRQVRY